MVSINYLGRTGNNLFQYSFAHIFAKKFGFTRVELKLTDKEWGDALYVRFTTNK